MWTSAKLLRPLVRVSILGGLDSPSFPPTHHSTRILLQDRAHASHLSLHTGNYGNYFQIDVDSGLLMRGSRPLDREQDSSHVLTVEAYNHDLGPMRSSVRVRPGAG